MRLGLWQHVGARVGTGCRSGAETKHVDLLRLPIFPEAVRQRPVCVCLCVPAAHASSTFPCEPAKETEPHERAVASLPSKEGSLVTGLPLQVLLTAQLSPHVDSPPVIPDC